MTEQQLKDYVLLKDLDGFEVITLLWPMVEANQWSYRKIDANLDREGGYTHCVVADKLQQALSDLEKKVGK